MELACLSRLPTGSLPAGWLENIRQVGEGIGVLPPYGGPRELGFPSGELSLTPWFSLPCIKLCFRVPLTL